MSEMNLPEEMPGMNLPQEVEGQPTGGAAAAVEDDCACTLWAVVNAGGGLVRRFRAINSVKLGIGITRVRFDRNVTGCAYIATIGLPGTMGPPPPGEISVVRATAFADGVVVATYASVGGFNIDLPFHLAVHCGPGAQD